MRKTKPIPRMVSVIRDASDYRLDYELPLERAKELLEQGKLCWDMTNHTYATHNRWDKPV